MNFKNGKYVKKKNPQVEKTDKVCKKFGCGKRLSHWESLFSEYCFNHARDSKHEIINKP